MSNLVHYAVPNTPGLTMSCCPHYQEIEIGKSLHLWCDITGLPHANIHWFHNDTSLADEHQNVKKTADARMHSAVQIDTVLPSNGGTYTCRVVSDIGSFNINFTVQTVGEFLVQYRLKNLIIIFNIMLK